MIETASQASTVPIPGGLTPEPPTIAQRITELENRCSGLLEMLQSQERSITALVNQNAELREETGMQPLPPVYFA